MYTELKERAAITAVWVKQEETSVYTAKKNQRGRRNCFEEGTNRRNIGGRWGEDTAVRDRELSIQSRTGEEEKGANEGSGSVGQKPEISSGGGGGV